MNAKQRLNIGGREFLKTKVIEDGRNLNQSYILERWSVYKDSVNYRGFEIKNDTTTDGAKLVMLNFRIENTRNILPNLKYCYKLIDKLWTSFYDEMGGSENLISETTIIKNSPNRVDKILSRDFDGLVDLFLINDVTGTKEKLNITIPSLFSIWESKKMKEEELYYIIREWRTLKIKTKKL